MSTPQGEYEEYTPLNAKNHQTKIIVVAAICTFFSTICPIFYLPAIPLIQEDLGATDFEMALTIFSNSIVCGIFPIFHGQISDYFGRKVILIPYLTAFFGSILITGSSTNVWILILGRGLMGIFSTGIPIFCTSMIADVVPAEKRATAVAYSLLLAMFANIIGGPVAGIMSDQLGWRSTFFTLLILLFPFILCIFFFVPETYRGVTDHSVKFKIHFLLPFKLVLTNPKIAYAAIPNSLTFSAVLVVNSLSPILIDSYYHFNAFVIGVLLMFFWIGSFLGSVFGGKISDYIRAHKGRGASLLVAASSSIIVGISVILFGFLIPFTPICCLLFLFTGFFNVTSRGVVFAFSTEVNPLETASIISGLVCIQFINVSIELLLSAALLRYFNPGPTFAILSLIIFASLIFAFLNIKREWRSDQSSTGPE